MFSLSATTYIGEEPILLPYIGPEFIEMILKRRTISETSSAERAVEQRVPDKREAPEAREGRLRVMLTHFVIITAQPVTRWMLVLLS